MNTNLVSVTAPAKLYVFDPDPGVAAACAKLARERGLGLVTNGSLEAFARTHDPDRAACLVFAIDFPGEKELEFLRLLRDRRVPLAVVALASRANVALAVRSFKNGVCDFLEKPVEEQALVESLAAAVDAAQERFRRRREWQAFEQRLAALTDRQREVLCHVVAGRPSKVIAYDLGISERTVEVHRCDLLRRMGVGSAVELAWLSGMFRFGLGACDITAQPRQARAA